MLTWTCLKILEYDVKQWGAKERFVDPVAGSSDELITVHAKPLDNIVLPDEAKGMTDRNFDAFTSPARFENGSAVLVCRDKGTIVGYAWTALQDIWVSESRVFLRVRDHEIVVYDVFVFPSYRGRRMRSQKAVGTSAETGWQEAPHHKVRPAILRLAAAAYREACKHGRTRLLTYVLSSERYPMKTNLHLAAKEFMSLYSLHVFGRFSLHWATGRAFASQFHR
jgi:hypothetical protein